MRRGGLRAKYCVRYIFYKDARLPVSPSSDRDDLLRFRSEIGDIQRSDWRQRDGRHPRFDNDQYALPGIPGLHRGRGDNLILVDGDQLVVLDRHRCRSRSRRFRGDGGASWPRGGRGRPGFGHRKVQVMLSSPMFVQFLLRHSRKRAILKGEAFFRVRVLLPLIRNH